MTRAVDIEGRGVRVNGRSVGVGSAIPDSVLAQYDPREQSTGTPTNLIDTSTNNNDASNNGISVVSDGINSTQSYYLDGTEYASLPDMFTGLGAAEAMLVLERDGLPTDNTTDGLWTITNTGDTLYPWAQSTGAIYDDFGRDARHNGSAQVTLTDGHIYNIRSGTNHAAEQNQTTVFDTSDGSVSWYSSPELGRSTPSEARYFVGWMGLVVFYDQVLDSTTRGEEYQRLADAYGITL